MRLGQVLAAPLVGAIRLYQRYLSPALPRRCKYYPTCSAYAVGSLRTHGPLKGSALAVWRLLRCNPWSAGGIDHVPDPGQWRGSHEVRVDAEFAGTGSARTLSDCGRAHTRA